MAAAPRLGLVLSGGGARGAYEVGVLAWLAEHAPEVLGAVRVITGASVGAINGAYLASRGLTPESVRALEAVWRDLHVEGVLHLSATRAVRMLGSGAFRLLGRGSSPAVGLFTTRRLEELVRDAIRWDALPGMMRDGRFDAVAVAATEIGSGRTHVFCDQRPDVPRAEWPRDRTLVGVPARLGPEHVLASSSIPFLFAPVQVGDYWYTDGGVRQNTPLSPALRLGATRLLVLSLAGRDERVDTPGEFPGLGQLLGKLLNSLFLDRMKWDLDRLERINDMLDAAAATCGEGALDRLRDHLVASDRRPYRRVDHVTVCPTVDIGALAARLLREPDRLRRPPAAPLRALFASDNLASADAASYLLFDGSFAGELIARGRADAEALGDRLRALAA